LDASSRKGSKNKTAGETSEVSTQSGSTQTNPTFSREDLGAAVSECKYHLHKQKKALNFLRSSAPIAEPTNNSELTSGSEDSEDSENSNTPEDNVGDIVCTGYFFKELAENRKSFSC
jgi:hypothetical protein